MTKPYRLDQTVWTEVSWEAYCEEQERFDAPHDDRARCSCPADHAYRNVGRPDASTACVGRTRHASGKCVECRLIIRTAGNGFTGHSRALPKEVTA